MEDAEKQTQVFKDLVDSESEYLQEHLVAMSLRRITVGIKDTGTQLSHLKVTLNSVAMSITKHHSMWNPQARCSWLAKLRPTST